MATIQAAKARLDARQREIDRAASLVPGDDVAPRAGKRGHIFKHPFGERLPEAQENLTHVDSQIMRPADGYQQGDNARATVGESSLIVAATVSNIASDAPQLLPVPGKSEVPLGSGTSDPADRCRPCKRGELRRAGSREPDGLHRAGPQRKAITSNDRSGHPSIHRTHAHMA